MEHGRSLVGWIVNRKYVGIGVRVESAHQKFAIVTSRGIGPYIPHNFAMFFFSEQLLVNDREKVEFFGLSPVDCEGVPGPRDGVVAAEGAESRRRGQSMHCCAGISRTDTDAGPRDQASSRSNVLGDASRPSGTAVCDKIAGATSGAAFPSETLDSDDQLRGLAVAAFSVDRQRCSSAVRDHSPHRS